MRNWTMKGTAIALTICAPLFLLLSNLYLLATPGYVRYEYSKPDFPPAWVYSSAERLRLAEATVYYLRSGAGAQYLADLRSDGRVAYNERELKHMVDVKGVLTLAFWVHACSGLVCGLGVWLAWRSARIRDWVLRAWIQGCIGLCGLLLTIGVLAYTQFNLFFTAFHRVFFSGDSWLFAYSDTLIQLFPLPFWMDATWILTLLTVGECVLISACAFLLLGRNGRTAHPAAIG